MDSDDQILGNGTQVCILSPENEEKETSICLVEHEIKDKEHCHDVAEDEINQREELKAKTANTKVSLGESLDAKHIKSSATSLDKPTKTVSGSQKFQKVHSSKGRPTGVGVQEGKSVVKPSDVHSGTLRQQEKVPRSPSNFTVPQPFALATDRRASLGGQVKTLSRNQVIKEDEKRTTNGDKGEDMNQNEALRPEEAKGQLRASTNTFNFNSDARAQRRKEFNSKLEERLTAKEAAKSQAQDKTKEVIEEEIKKFRKGLTFKATPMPLFYQDSTPPKLEFKKIPPTRARSPKLGRKNNSISATHKTKQGAMDPNEEDQNTKENNGEAKVEVKTRKPRYLAKKVSGARSDRVAEKQLESVTDNNSEKHEIAMEPEAQSNASGTVIVV